MDLIFGLSMSEVVYCAVVLLVFVAIAFMVKRLFNRLRIRNKEPRQGCLYNDLPQTIKYKDEKSGLILTLRLADDGETRSYIIRHIEP